MEVLLKLILPVHRIRRWHYNLTPAESKFKTPMLDHQDKYMMKAQERMIADMDTDVDVTLKDVALDAKIDESADKEDNAVKRYQALKRKPQTKAQARKNMMIYLRNVAGFKMDYFKEMTYDDIRLIFEKNFNSNVAFLMKTKEQMDEENSRALKRLSESQDDKTAKKQKLDKELSLLVKRRYPLTRFTLDQMLNNVRLEVEKESEVSLELLSFGVDAAKEFKENMLSD
uniref:Uncharacterized protein n=1 Tax=Tanacetum cinerariifolium TaxID=118510 RepID=A0A6L2LEB9_TANCI|nr:hypothetical protein [Tanacetum cinerariifolium]